MSPFVLNTNKYIPPEEVKKKESRIQRGREGVTGHLARGRTCGLHPSLCYVHRVSAATAFSLLTFSRSGRAGRPHRRTPSCCKDKKKNALLQRQTPSDCPLRGAFHSFRNLELIFSIQSPLSLISSSVQTPPRDP